MHEEEFALADSFLKNSESTNSFMIGQIDEDDLSRLLERGIIVQEVDPIEKRNTPGLSMPEGPFFSNKIRVARDLMPDDAIDIDLYGDNYYVLRLNGPLITKWKDRLIDQGTELIEYIPEYSYKILIDSSNLQGLRSLEFVVDVSLYDENDTGILSEKSLSSEPNKKEVLTFDILLHREEDKEELFNWLNRNNITIQGEAKRKIRAYFPQGTGLLRQLANRKEVSTIEEYIKPKLFNDRARSILNLSSPHFSNNDFEFEGEGQIIAIADTGIDDSHADFKGRIVKAIPLGRKNDYSDPNGHGTHVTGSALGDGSGSNGNYKGTAPKAKLVFQSLMDSQGGLSGIPVDLAQLFEEAYNEGARIHNNSWGAATQSRYTINSSEVDAFCHDKKDMLILIAAGNEGHSNGVIHSQSGFVDWLSIGSPASSKNSLTVGASRTDRTSGGLSKLTYNVAWPSSFPDNPIAQATVSGDDEEIAGFSSRGPCDDQRIKPDVVAPGTDIISAKSSKAPSRNFWGNVAGNNNYAYMGGTSMACPLVAGCSALIREYYIKHRSHDFPSSALIKATIINGARRLSSIGATADHRSIPNYHQGFGRVDMLNTIPNKNSNISLEYIDSYNDPNVNIQLTGDKAQFIVDVGDNMPLRICMAYTDVAGRALQNNLNLLVEIQSRNGSRKKYIGNEEFRVLPGNLHIPDPDNNVEIVRLEVSGPSKCLIQVMATNLLTIGQDFSLVVTGDIRGKLIKI